MRVKLTEKTIAALELPRASFSSRVRAATCSWSSVVDTPAVGALCALGLVTRCPFTGCPLSPRRCMSLPYNGFTTMLNPRQILVFAPHWQGDFEHCPLRLSWHCRELSPMSL